MPKNPSQFDKCEWNGLCPPFMHGNNIICVGAQILGNQNGKKSEEKRICVEEGRQWEKRQKKVKEAHIHAHIIRAKHYGNVPCRVFNMFAHMAHNPSQARASSNIFQEKLTLIFEMWCVYSALPY